MKQAVPYLMAAILLITVAGLGILRVAAAREVARTEGRDFASVLLWTRWFRGRSPRARLLRNIGVLWFLVMLASFVLLSWYGQE